jgi:hypothetical protein
MSATLSAHAVLITYWVVMLVICAFFLRMACSICRTDMPSWRRSFVAVVVVAFLAYLTFDFTAYLVMRSMSEVLIQVPPGYGYNHWFREPFALKWLIITHAGPLRYMPFIFGLCAAGVLQVIVLQAEVTFRFGLVIAALQWGATAVAGYVVALLFGVGLSAAGWKAQPETAPQPAEQAQAQPQAGPAAPPRGRRALASRNKLRAKRTAKATPPTQAAATTAAPAAQEPTALEVAQQKAEGAGRSAQEQLREVGENFKAYANSHLDELKEDLEPVTKHLPEPVMTFLDKGGWWGVLGVLAVLALLWLRWLVRKLGGAIRPRRKKKKKRRTKSVTVNLKENLQKIGHAYTEEGPRQITVRGLPARLRLVVLSSGTRNMGGLSEEMVDRVLDWIKPGLSEVTAGDYPRVRPWPPFYSFNGFATALAANVPIPEPQGDKSHWVVVAGQVKMGRQIIHVGLALYADSPNTLRNIKVQGEQWLSVLGVAETGEPVRAR